MNFHCAWLLIPLPVYPCLTLRYFWIIITTAERKQENILILLRLILGIQKMIVHLYLSSKFSSKKKRSNISITGTCHSLIFKSHTCGHSQSKLRGSHIFNKFYLIFVEIENNDNLPQQLVALVYYVLHTQKLFQIRVIHSSAARNESLHFYVLKLYFSNSNLRIFFFF